MAAGIRSDYTGLLYMHYMYSIHRRILWSGDGMIAVRLPEDIERRLAELAARTGRTKTFYVREAVLEYLDEMEERYIAIDRLEHPAKRWTLDEMERDLDVDG